MKTLILALGLAVGAIGLAPADAEAKRLGGGGSSGMKREMPARSAPDAAPGKPAAPAATPNAAGAAPAAAPKRSWMGPIAGLAAGLGLAALMSHMGLGEEFGNILMMALLAVAAVFLVRFLMRRFGPVAQRGAAPAGMQFAGQGAGLGAGSGALPMPASTGSGWGAPSPAPINLQPMVEQDVAPASPAQAAPSLPADFDAAAFERIAKMIFIRMQAANDAGDLNDLRAFTTPVMFATARLEIQERGASAQQTDVVKIEAQVLDFAVEPQRNVVSVRFHGLVREEKDGTAQPFDEVWHLVKPTDGSREWAIAGIQQTA